MTPLSAQKRAEARVGLMLAAPAILLLVLLVVLPVLATAGFSLTDYRLGTQAIGFAGFDNYAALWNDPRFWQSVANTATYTLIVVPGSVGLGLGAALLIESRGWLKPFYRVAYFLPVASTFIAMAIVWEFLMNPSVGLFNQILAALGLPSVNFLGNPQTALYSMAAIGIWELTGFNMVLFMAGLSAIPRDLYDASAVDGAESGWDRFRMVTWPMLGPTTFFVVIITMIRAVRVFEVAAVITQGRPEGATEVLLYSIYVQAFQYFNIGYAAALIVVFLAVTALIALAQARFGGQREANR
ncbi:multiple sugar transport system permease protein [Rhizobium sp. NFR07]|uniref:carbohydrate ABC transporter permease n=1 Tax=Rhizobium sp. NFR07 TaxID=1566262 RepID=UPI0008EFA5C1|nr:sugar ABC transporter permease [Rhizobium sp. NFR07]SFB43494.1 multiple sugar transport system permease protein [Rhizobium sp. NFR07]